MRKLLLFLLIPFYSYAQEPKGILFEQGLSWAKVLAKAKSEHKYIFVDCYASWCGPCKAMERDVYTNDTVAEEFNQNFVSFKIQLDKTAKDNEAVKNHYGDADLIGKQYKINSYPTFLFFSPDGELVHQGLGYQSVAQFIQIAKDARDPRSQYYILMKRYQAGQRNPAEMYSLALEAKAMDQDRLATAVANDELGYLFTQNDQALLTESNIRFIASFTQTSKDKGYVLFTTKGRSVDAVMKSDNYTRDIIDKVVIKEEVDPQTQNGNPDWKKIANAITVKYDATTADRATTKARIYGSYGNDWPAFTAALVHYTDTYEDKNNLQLLNKNAHYVLQYSKSKAELQAALAWNALTLLKEPENREFKRAKTALQTKLTTIK